MLDVAKRLFRRGCQSHLKTTLPDATGIVVHALHKSASMFLHKFFKDLAERAEVTFFSIHNDPPDHNSLLVDRSESFVLCPIRSFQTESFVFPRLKNVRHFFQVRDPRDILVSEYFSLGWRHTDEHWTDEAKQRRKQIQSMGIDEFVLTESLTGKTPLVERMNPVLEHVSQANATVVKYETMIEDFKSWADSILTSCRFANRVALLADLEAMYRDEFLPDADSQGHKRNVKAGDHRDKLKKATISELNKKFARVLRSLDYQL